MEEVKKPWIVIETNEWRQTILKAFSTHKRAAHYINFKILEFLQEKELPDEDYRLIDENDTNSRSAHIYDPPCSDYYWIDWTICNIHEMQDEDF